MPSQMLNFVFLVLQVKSYIYHRKHLRNEMAIPAFKRKPKIGIPWPVLNLDGAAGCRARVSEQHTELYGQADSGPYTHLHGEQPFPTPREQGRSPFPQLSQPSHPAIPLTPSPSHRSGGRVRRPGGLSEG